MKKLIMVGLLALTMGCSQIVGEVKQIVGDDLTRQAELATKYGKPELAQCANFLNTALNSQDSMQTKIDALIAEPTSGILSAAFKAYLLAELAKSLNDPIAQAELQKGFDTNCHQVVGQIFINLIRDARKIGTRGIGR